MSTDRLVDEFLAEVARREIHLPGEVEIYGTFGDLLWAPRGSSAEVVARHDSDPAFGIKGYSRWVVLARIFDEVRYYAASLAGGALELDCGEAERVAAIRAEPDRYELGVFRGIPDAVSLVSSYLTGMPLEQIDTIRRGPRAEFP